MVILATPSSLRFFFFFSGFKRDKTVLKGDLDKNRVIYIGLMDVMKVCPDFLKLCYTLKTAIRLKCRITHCAVFNSGKCTRLSR